MRYTHCFDVQAPLDAVVEFHRRSDSMGAITPPPVIARVQQAPSVLAEGDDMKFTLWLGPLPLRWHARIEDVTDNGFTDRQISGPFRQWNHRHTFVVNDESSTIVRDEIDIELSDRPLWRAIGALMVLNLPILFAYRGWKTKRLLNAGHANAAQQQISTSPSDGVPS